MSTSVEDEIRAWPVWVQSLTCWSAHLKDVQVVGIDKEQGIVTCSMVVGPEHCNPMGSMHGGCSATLVDEVSTLALRAFDRTRRSGVSVTLTTEYLAAIPIDTTLLLEARCSKVGRTLAFLTCDIKDRDSKRVFVRGTHVKFVGEARL
jgi:acyl-coenzyme A thioesterase 13